MEGFAESFNALSKSQMAPRIKLQDLRNPNGYDITAFKMIRSKDYGRRIIVSLQVPEKKREDSRMDYEAFLPKRFLSLFTEERIDDYNRSPDLKLRFVGIGDHREIIVEIAKSF